MLFHTILTYDKRGGFLAYIATIAQKTFGEEGQTTNQTLKSRKVHQDSSKLHDEYIQQDINESLAKRKVAYLLNPFKWLELALCFVYESWNRLTLIGKHSRPKNEDASVSKYHPKYQVGYLTFWSCSFDFLRIILRIPLYFIGLAHSAVQWFSSMWNQVWRPFRNYILDLYHYGAGGSNPAFGKNWLGGLACFGFIVSVLGMATLMVLTIFFPPTIAAFLPFAPALSALIFDIWGLTGAIFIGGAMTIGTFAFTSSILRNIKPFFRDLYYSIRGNAKGYDAQMEMIALATYEEPVATASLSPGLTQAAPQYGNTDGVSLYERSNAESHRMFNDRLTITDKRDFSKLNEPETKLANLRDSMFFTPQINQTAKLSNDPSDPLLNDKNKISTSEFGCGRYTTTTGFGKAAAAA